MTTLIDTPERRFYLEVALPAVRSVELEQIIFLKSLSERGLQVFKSSVELEKCESIVRGVLGWTSLAACMEDYDGVIKPLLGDALVAWREHLKKFGTENLATELNTLEVWQNDSMNAASFIAWQAIDVLAGDETYFLRGACSRVEIDEMFPLIEKWQHRNDRSPNGSC
jgi:hypothetical protein